MGTHANVHVVDADNPSWRIRLHTSHDGDIGDLILHACALPVLIANLALSGRGGPFGWQWDLLVETAQQTGLDANRVGSLALFDTAPEGVASWLIGSRFNFLFPVPDSMDALDQYAADVPDMIVEVDTSFLPTVTVRPKSKECRGTSIIDSVRRMAEQFDGLEQVVPGAGWRFSRGKVSYCFDLTVAALAVRAANGADPIPPAARDLLVRLLGRPKHRQGHAFQGAEEKPIGPQR